jgi:cytidine deaminase
MTDDELVEMARRHVGEFPLSEPDLTAGSVSAALLTERGNVYTGVCVDLSCGIGFCAEHAAVAEMLKSRETVVRKMVAVGARRILPPCGRCRELVVQVDRRNFACEVILPGGKRTLAELLPDHWMAQGA